MYLRRLNQCLVSLIFRETRGPFTRLRYMSYSLSFSPEFYDSEDEYSKDRPFTVRQAIMAMPDDRFAEMARKVFGCEPDFVDADTVMQKITETDTCGTLSSPVDVYIDPEGYFTVDVYETPRHIPIPGSSPAVPLCGNETQGETVAWLDRNHLANCPKCQELEPDA